MCVHTVCFIIYVCTVYAIHTYIHMYIGCIYHVRVGSLQSHVNHVVSSPPSSLAHSSDFQAVNSSLVAVNSNITALNSTAQNISNQLEVLRMELMNLRTTCMGSALFVVMPTACDGIPDPGSIPDVTAGLSVSGS